jgi:putative flavoprotein involved in K+ transport
MFSQSYPVIVLGAGPAGLSVAHELTRRGLPCLILEKGSQAGESFAHYPKHIWFGPWLNNTLPGSQVGWTWLARRSSQPAYAWYLSEYARHKDLPIRFETYVSKVVKQGDRYRLETNAGSLTCDYLINATGYFSKPYVPNVAGMLESAIPFLHSAQYREADDARRFLGRESGRVLVVGQGLSAGETMCQLAREGFQVGLSHRGPLRLGPSPTVEALLSPLAWIREQLAVRLGWRLNSNPPMAGGESRRLLRSGIVKTFPTIDSFDKTEVVFSNGRRETFDLVVFCTGYRYAQDHLAEILGHRPPELRDGVESTISPGLFFLGLDQQRSFRSRFLRGIRSDAVYLGALLAARLAGLSARNGPEERSGGKDLVVDLDLSPQALSLSKSR